MKREEQIMNDPDLDCNKAAYYIQDISDFTRKKFRITFDEDYEVNVKGGEIIAISKTTNLPKTFEDCCKVLDVSPYIGLIYDLNDGADDSLNTIHLELLRAFRELMICRDAYRKIAGWKPWKNAYNGQREMFCIAQSGPTVRFDKCTYQGCMLMFPTEDMCKVFYENFKELIIKCHDII